MIFIDSNVPVYLIGGPHAHKVDAQLMLEGLVAGKRRLVCDAEVLQEIPLRYSAIGRRESISPAMNVLPAIVDEVFPIERQDVLRAATIVAGKESHSARVALHIAVMERHGIETIFSFDRDYDRRPGLVRIAPV